MSSDVTRYPVLYSTPKGHAFELREERPWSVETPVVTLSRVLIAKVTWEGSLVLPDPLALAGLPNPPEKASWKPLGFARWSAWRLLMLAARVDDAGAKSAGNLIRREAAWLPFSYERQGPVLCGAYATGFRAAARSMRSYMIWSVRFARLQHVCGFWAARRIISGELALLRMREVALAIQKHDVLRGDVLVKLVEQLALGEADVAEVQKSVAELPPESEAHASAFLKDLNAYAFQAWL